MLPIILFLTSVASASASLLPRQLSLEDGIPPQCASQCNSVAGFETACGGGNLNTCAQWCSPANLSAIEACLTCVWAAVGTKEDEAYLNAAAASLMHMCESLTASGTVYPTDIFDSSETNTVASATEIASETSEASASDVASSDAPSAGDISENSAINVPTTVANTGGIGIATPSAHPITAAKTSATPSSSHKPSASASASASKPANAASKASIATGVVALCFLAAFV